MKIQGVSVNGKPVLALLLSDEEILRMLRGEMFTANPTLGNMFADMGKQVLPVGYENPLNYRIAVGLEPPRLPAADKEDGAPEDQQRKIIAMPDRMTGE